MVELNSEPPATNAADSGQRMLEQFEENKASLNSYKFKRAEGPMVDRLLPHDLGKEQFNN